MVPGKFTSKVLRTGMRKGASKSLWGVGVDALLYAIEKYIPTPQRDLEAPFLMPVLRTFDVNLPGTIATSIKGGVIGGSIIQGKVQVGDEI